VRDFPVYLGRAYVQCPLAPVRRELAENLYEEETGGLSYGTPHPELFMRYPRGLGMDCSRFEDVSLLPAGQRYRDHLDDTTTNHGWEIATCVSTLFLEGTRYERGEVDDSAPKRPVTPLEDHPLVKHYGLPLECLALTRAHRKIEGEHRGSAWHIVLDYIPQDSRAKVIPAMEATLQQWLAYRDDVAHACGVRRDDDGAPYVPLAAAS